MKEEIQKWFDKSKRDLKTAENSLKSKDYYASVFWCQQAVEKAFKSLLIKNTNQFPKIHDLVKLAKLAESPKNIIEKCGELNPSYTETRYPDLPGDYSKEDTEEFIKIGKEILKWIEKNL